MDKEISDPRPPKVRVISTDSDRSFRTRLIEAEALIDQLRANNSDLKAQIDVQEREHRLEMQRLEDKRQAEVNEFGSELAEANRAHNNAMVQQLNKQNEIERGFGYQINTMIQVHGVESEELMNQINVLKQELHAVNNNLESTQVDMTAAAPPGVKSLPLDLEVCFDEARTAFVKTTRDIQVQLERKLLDLEKKKANRLKDIEAFYFFKEQELKNRHEAKKIVGGAAKSLEGANV